jgi:hypothetical protein
MATQSFAAIFVASFLSLVALPVNATTLVSTDLNIAGDGLLTVDPATSLQWLDLTATLGQSRASVSSGSFSAQGFRYATSAEVLKFWQDAGSSVTTSAYTSTLSDFAAASQLIDMMGCTSSAVYYAVGCAVKNGFANDYWDLGFFGTDSESVAFVGYKIGPTFYDPDEAGHGQFYLNFGTEVGTILPGTDIRRGDIGSYLVREIPVSGVPEPDVWTMMILGFGVTGGALRMRRRREMAISAGV